MANSNGNLPVDADASLAVRDVFSHNGGIEKLRTDHLEEFKEIVRAIEGTKAADAWNKQSDEDGKGLLVSPGVLNYDIQIEGLYQLGWNVDYNPAASKEELKQLTHYSPPDDGDPEDNCTIDLEPDADHWATGRRSVDALKNKVGLECQFGKYTYIEYDALIKFGHFKYENKIDVGVEILASSNMLRHMSSGPHSIDRLSTIFGHLPDEYISPEHGVPLVGLGVGFEGDKVLEMEDGDLKMVL